MDSRSVVVFLLLSIITFLAAKSSHWCSWSPCSASCGKGTQTRVKTSVDQLHSLHTKQKVESRTCFKQFCPSYLSWPRMHFSGKLVADVPTVNNVRCNFENKHFSPTKWSTIFGFLVNHTGPLKHFSQQRSNWNAFGTGHTYFYNASIKSICTSHGVCAAESTQNAIIGSKVTEIAHGRMVDLDPDWQTSSQIWGMSVSIPAVLTGNVVPASIHMVNTRENLLSGKHKKDLSKGYIYMSSTVFKSKLINVTWISEHYKKLFKSALELSFVFTYDLFDQYDFEGRVTGTIGLTSQDDSTEMFAGRNMQSYGGMAKHPFFFYEDKKVLIVDLSSYFSCDKDGSFNQNYGSLDLAIIVNTKEYCRLKRSYNLCMLKFGSSTAWYMMLTTNGEITRLVGNDSDWYLTYGGIIEVNLRHLKKIHLKLIKISRVVLLSKSKKYGKSVAMAAEAIHGINTGVVSTSILRMNPNDTLPFTVFASLFGKPAKNMKVSLQTAKFSAPFECPQPLACNRSLGVPVDAIEYSPKICIINDSGICNFKIFAAKDPGPVRAGCKVDGQIYPIQIWSNYTHKNVVVKFMEGITKQNIDGVHRSTTLTMAVRLFNAFQVKTCPTWEDVKDIFQQYHNLYPVMAHNGIINLMSYENVRKKSKMLRASMFETDFSNPGYMPTTRDLSKSKMQLIKNWLDCGMRKESDMPNQLQCDHNTLSEQLQETRMLLQKALLIELSTIPLYFTACLSMKTELGRNIGVAKILKSIYTEEMLHMTLAANILNAVDGNVNLSNVTLLPEYPNVLEFGEFFELLPGRFVSIEPMSLDLVQDVFSAIEKPANKYERKLISNIAKLWKLLPKDKENKPFAITRTMDHFMQANPTKRNASKTDLSWTNVQSVTSETLNQLNGIRMSSISSLYTKIAVQLSFMESCSNSLYQGGNKDGYSGSIFTGDPNHQINSSYWYGEEALDSDNVYITNKTLKKAPFAVTNLRTALEAIVEVVYQGEGGSSCSPSVNMLQNNEYSHYYRFQEIVKGRKLIKVQKPPYWQTDKCLNLTEDCPELKQLDADYCYLGKEIHFDKDGVWPIVSNPNHRMYEKGTKAQRLDHEFSKTYTRLLLCLEDAFRGKPAKLKSCMVDMYGLKVTGKKMVKTPIGAKRDSTSYEFGKYGLNASPTWRFLRKPTSTSGLPVQLN